ncbi:hypothetical protein GCM10022243_32320 [Saccharothrix violaceirubra]
MSRRNRDPGRFRRGLPDSDRDRVMSPVMVLTTTMPLVFFGLLLRSPRPDAHKAGVGRHRLAARAGRHWREPKRPPTRALRRAVRTAGTHGLGLIRDDPPVRKL